jgi:hypothetical protein
VPDRVQRGVPAVLPSTPQGGMMATKLASVGAILLLGCVVTAVLAMYTASALLFLGAGAVFVVSVVMHFVGK